MTDTELVRALARDADSADARAAEVAQVLAAVVLAAGEDRRLEVPPDALAAINGSAVELRWDRLEDGGLVVTV